MKKTEQLRKGIYLISIVIALAIPIIAWLINERASIIFLCGVGTFTLFLALIFMDNLYKSHIDRMLIDLSNLIDRMIDLEERQVFSDVEDTLLSKLQYQVIKLSGILRAQNKAMNQEKNEIKSLISDISHQIKTPVASLKMFSDLLQEPNLTAEQHREYYQMYSQSLERLAFLVDNLIKMSRLEGGIIELKMQMESVNDVILQAVKQVYEKAKKKNIDLLFEENKETMIILDKKWTIEAIFNVLDNAVKYTHAGGKVTISVMSYEFFVRIDISDNGIGIREQELAKIFKRFYRGQNTVDVEGIGIGLYISRKIITEQGGYIKVQSCKNGSIFSVFLPLNR
ncbi:two-component sensor histidine kinase [Robertmurraya siralis]|uniref:histidine kinase n=2 Tax=Robertmurraya siralis TaxID=77777 RepID=A0A919WHM1_9BACI|nr:two-component sensor histidine kinase [Robertmurraya siralis]